MAAQPRKPRKPRTANANPRRIALVNDSLRATPLADARADFDALDTEFAIVPHLHRPTFDRDWDLLMATCATLKITSAHGLIDRHSRVLETATGVNDAHMNHHSDQMHALHRLRNTALAVVAATVPEHDPRAILDATRTTLRPRIPGARPRLFDDDITLLRAVTAVGEAGRPGAKRHGAYALCDAGMLAAETPLANRSALVTDHDKHTAILATGNRHTSERLLPLEQFHRRILQEAITQANDDSAPLTYGGRYDQAGSASAIVSAASMLGDLLYTAGLAHPGITARSITAWRINYTWRAHRGHPTDPADSSMEPQIERACDEIIAISGRDLGAALDLGGISIHELERKLEPEPTLDFMTVDPLTYCLV